MTTKPKTLEDLMREGVIVLSPKELAEIERTDANTRKWLQETKEAAAAPPSKTGKSIPIKAAREIGESLGYTQVIITAFDKNTGRTHITTWGKSVEDCEQAADGGNFVKKALGWPEEKCRAIPSRARKQEPV